MSVFELLPDPVGIIVPTPTPPRPEGDGQFAELLARSDDDKVEPPWQPRDDDLDYDNDYYDNDYYDNDRPERPAEDRIADRDTARGDRPDRVSADANQFDEVRGDDHGDNVTSPDRDTADPDGDTATTEQPEQASEPSGGETTVATDDQPPADTGEEVTAKVAQADGAPAVIEPMPATPSGELTRAAAVINAPNHANGHSALFSGKFTTVEGAVPAAASDKITTPVLKPALPVWLHQLRPASGWNPPDAPTPEAPTSLNQPAAKAAAPKIAIANADGSTALKADASAPKTAEPFVGKPVAAPEADLNLPTLRMLGAISRFLPPEQGEGTASLLQYFQARLNQMANPDGNSANPAVNNLAQALKLAGQGQNLNAGAANGQGQTSGNQMGQTIAAAAKGGGASQNGQTGGSFGQFTNNLALAGAGPAAPVNLPQLQQGIQVMNSPAPHQPATNMQTPTVQIAFHLAKALEQGLNRMSIRLDPAELGRVQIQLEVGADGRTAALITVDRQETLDLLQRDARTLERALRDAGLDTSEDDLEFSLRQGDDPGSRKWRQAGDGNGNTAEENDETVTDVTSLADFEPPYIITDRAVDLRV